SHDILLSFQSANRELPQQWPHSQLIVIVCASLIWGKESDVNRCETLQSFRRAPNRPYPFSPGAIAAGSNPPRLRETGLHSQSRPLVRWKLASF
ncbi:MAG TPA: hypothetical protein VNO32_16955, partial [Candidatus Acidoferrum sp.]|nr:hypothetical protein [Candidatus Acidoferrum sp.]